MNLPAEASAHLPPDASPLRNIVLASQSYTGSGGPRRDEAPTWDDQAQVLKLHHSEEDRQKGIRNFLNHTRWQTKEGGQGKAWISWLELFAWYILHSPKPERPRGNALLEKKGNLQKEIAEFKKDIQAGNHFLLQY